MDKPVAAPGRAERLSLWLTLSALMAVMLVSYLVRLLWSSAALDVGADLKLDPVAIGSFVTAFYAGYVASNVVGGVLADRLGARAILCVALGGLALLTAAFGQIHTLGQGLIIQALMGICSGSFFCASAKLLVSVFPRARLGLAFGLLASPASVGIILANAVFPSALSHWRWPSVYLATGIALLPILALCLWLPRQAKPAPGERESLGADLARSGAELVRDRGLMLLAAAGFAGTWASWGFTFWIAPLLIQERGLTAMEAGSVAALVGVGAAATKPVYGLWADLSGRRRLFAAASLAAFAVLAVSMGSLRDLATLRLLAPLIGFAAFGYSPLIAALIGERVAPERSGAAIGFVHAVAQCGNLAAPISVGWVYSATGSMTATLGALATVALVGAGAIAAISLELPKQRPAHPPVVGA